MYRRIVTEYQKILNYLTLSSESNKGCVNDSDISCNMKFIAVAPTHPNHTMSELARPLTLILPNAQSSTSVECAVAQQFAGRREAVLGYSLRALIDAFASITVRDGASIVVHTALIHDHPHSILTELGVDLVGIDVDLNTLGTQYTTVDPARVAFVLISHVDGTHDLNIEPLLDWAVEYDIPVFEDCTQAGWCHDYTGNPRSTCVGWSTGIDKIPYTVVGAFLLTSRGYVAHRLRTHMATWRQTIAIRGFTHNRPDPTPMEDRIDPNFIDAMLLGTGNGKIIICSIVGGFSMLWLVLLVKETQEFSVRSYFLNQTSLM